MRPTSAESLLDDAVRGLCAALPGCRVEASLDGFVRRRDGAASGTPVTCDVSVLGVRRGGVSAWVPAGGAEAALVTLSAELLAANVRLATLEAVMASDVLMLGEANGSIIHEVNNHINGIVLQSMLLQSKLEGPLKERAAGMRAQGVKAAEVMRTPQLVELWPAGPNETADLVAVARGVAAESGAAVRVDGEKTAAISAVAAERAVRLLLRLGRAFGAAGIAVGEAGAEVTLPTPPGGTAEQPRLPEAEGVEALVGQALEWLMRRTDGDMVVEPVAEGTRVRLAWK